jgi:chemotaxis signal transduction protein
MSTDFAARAAALRDVFDRGFAAPPPSAVQAAEDFLAIRLEDAPYALRLADITALAVDSRIIAVPGQFPALLGLAGFRGALLPVYALGALLGHDATLPARWLVRADELAFAFTRLDGHLRLSATQFLPLLARASAQGHVKRHVSGFLQLADHRRPVLDMAALRAAVRALAGTDMKETASA